VECQRNLLELESELGFVAGPEDVIFKIASFQAHMSSCISLPLQKGFAKFLTVDSDMVFRKGICQHLLTKRNIIVKSFQELPGFKDLIWEIPMGGFYFFVNISNYLGKQPKNLNNGEVETGVISNDEELALYLLKTAKVVTVPGSRFERPNHLRIAFASSNIDWIKKGMQFLSDALERLE